MSTSDRSLRFSIGSFLFGVASATTVAFCYAVFVKSVPPGIAMLILAIVIAIEALSGLAVYSKSTN